MNSKSILRTLALTLFLAGICRGMSAQSTFPRNVLIEEFTSVTCTPCAQATPIINRMIAQHPGRVFSVRYHMNFPTAGDPWYLANPTDNEGRRGYYDVAGIPAARVDGDGLKPSPTNESDMTSAITSELASPASLKLDVGHTIRNDTSITATVRVTANASGLSGTYALRVAVLEKHVIDSSVTKIPGSNKETEFYDVMRTILPSLSGQPITLNPSQYKDYTFTTSIPVKWKPGQLFVVAWVQDEYSPNPVMGVGASSPASGVNDPVAQIFGISLGRNMPNPASDQTVISYTVPSSMSVRVELQDMTGHTVQFLDCGHQEPGAHTVAVSLNSLSAGTYRYTLIAGSQRLSRMMTVLR